MKFDLKLPDFTTSIDWQSKRNQTVERTYEGPPLSPSLKEEFQSFLSGSEQSVSRSIKKPVVLLRGRESPERSKEIEQTVLRMSQQFDSL